jgi:hypothetical protein
MTKVKSLTSNLVAIKRSATLPAVQSPRKWKDFDQFVRDADALVEQIDAADAVVTKINSGKKALHDWTKLHNEEKLAKLIEDVREGLRVHDRNDDDDRRYEVDGDLCRKFTSERLGVMVSSYANAKPATPKVYGRMLLEHVLSKDPTACELESTCRKLVEREKPFIPEIGEVIAMLKSEQQLWERRRDAVHRAIAEVAYARSCFEEEEAARAEKANAQ